MTDIPGWKPDKYELAWAAGFYDGEGTVGCYSAGNSANSMTLKLTIQNTEFEPVARFYRAVGELGSVTGPYEREGNRRPIGRFRAGRFEDVQAIAAMLWKFLSGPKRRQATTAIQQYIAWRKSR